MHITTTSLNFMVKTPPCSNKTLSKCELLKKGQNDVFFTGKDYPSGYYEDSEIEDAKKYMEKPNWEKDYVKNRIKQVFEDAEKDIKELNAFQRLLYYGAFKPTVKVIFRESFLIDDIVKLRTLMVDLKNEEIEKKEKEKINLANQTKEKTIELLVKNQLRTDFLDPLKNDDNVPTAVMITENTKKKREGLINWLKDQVTCRFIECNESDEDEIANRIDFELEYAKERFDKTGNKLRTILYVKNMDKLLENDRPDIKNLMSELVRDKAPLTLLFHTGSSSNIANAYISNRTRIPVKVKFDSSMLDDIKKDAKEQI